MRGFLAVGRLGIAAQRNFIARFYPENVHLLMARGASATAADARITAAVYSGISLYQQYITYT